MKAKPRRNYHQLGRSEGKETFIFFGGRKVEVQVASLIELLWRTLTLLYLHSSLHALFRERLGVSPLISCAEITSLAGRSKRAETSRS